MFVSNAAIKVCAYVASPWTAIEIGGEWFVHYFYIDEKYIAGRFLCLIFA